MKINLNWAAVFAFPFIVLFKFKLLWWLGGIEWSKGSFGASMFISGIVIIGFLIARTDNSINLGSITIRLPTKN